MMPAASLVHSPSRQPTRRRRQQAPFVVLGVDPGLHKTGYAALVATDRKPVVKEAGVLVTPERAELGDRLQQLHRDAGTLIRDLRPDAVVLEDLFVHRQFPRAAIVLGHARAAIYLAAAAAGVRVVTLTPGAVKHAIAGSGRAAKAQVQTAVSRLLGVGRLGDAHAADALALAYAGLSRIGALLR